MTHEAYEAWKKAHAERWVEQEDFFAGWEAARSTLTPSRVSREPEPVAWYDPTNRNPGQSVTFDRAKHEKWPHIYRQPLYPPLAHEGISEGRPEKAIAHQACASGQATDAPNTGLESVPRDDGRLAAALMAVYAEVNRDGVIQKGPVLRIICDALGSPVPGDGA